MPGSAILASTVDSDAQASAPLFAVVNRGSGRRDADQVRDTLLSLAAQAGRRAEVKVVSRPWQLPVLIDQAVVQARRGGGIVVAAGGDGTLNAVAQAVLPTGLPMGILPKGTFNYFGRALGIPTETEEAARRLLEAVPQPVQVGLVNGRVFLVNASLGLHPQLLQDREALTRRFGRSQTVALWAALMTLLQRPRRLLLEVQCDGRQALLYTTTLFVGNNRLQLERLGIAEAEALERGRLAGISLRPVGRLAMAGLLLRSALGRLGDATPVDTLAFREMKVQPWLPAGRRGIRVALDGEMVRMAPPLQFSVSPQPLWVMVPPAAPPQEPG